MTGAAEDVDGFCLPLYYDVLGLTRHEPVRDIYKFLKVNFENLSILRNGYDMRRGGLFIAELEHQIVYKKNKLEKDLADLKKASNLENREVLQDIDRLEKQVQLIEKNRSTVPELVNYGERSGLGRSLSASDRQAHIKSESKAIETLYSVIEKITEEISEAQMVLLYLVKKAYKRMKRALTELPSELSAVVKCYSEAVDEAFLVLSNPEIHRKYMASSSHDSFVINNQALLGKLLAHAPGQTGSAVKQRTLLPPKPSTQVKACFTGSAEAPVLSVCWVITPEVFGMATQYEVQVDVISRTGYRRLKFLPGLSSVCRISAKFLRLDPSLHHDIVIRVRGLNIRGSSPFSPNYYLSFGPLVEVDDRDVVFDAWLENYEFDKQKNRLLSYFQEKLSRDNLLQADYSLPLLVGWLHASFRSRVPQLYPKAFLEVDLAISRLMRKKLKDDDLQRWKARLESSLRRTVAQHPYGDIFSVTVADDAKLVDPPFTRVGNDTSAFELLEDLVHSIDEEDVFKDFGQEKIDMLANYLIKAREVCPLLVIEVASNFSGELSERNGSWIVTGSGNGELLGSPFPIWRFQTPHDRVRAAIRATLVTTFCQFSSHLKMKDALRSMESECTKAELEYLRSRDLVIEDLQRSRQSTLKQEDMQTPSGTAQTSPVIHGECNGIERSSLLLATPENSELTTPKEGNSPSSFNRDMNIKSGKKKKRSSGKAKNQLNDEGEVLLSIPIDLESDGGPRSQADLLRSFAELDFGKAESALTRVKDKVMDAEPGKGLSENSASLQSCKEKSFPTGPEHSLPHVEASSDSLKAIRSEKTISPPSIEYVEVDDVSESQADDDLLRLLSIQSGQSLQQLKGTLVTTPNLKVEKAFKVDGVGKSKVGPSDAAVANAKKRNPCPSSTEEEVSTLSVKKGGVSRGHESSTSKRATPNVEVNKAKKQPKGAQPSKNAAESLKQDREKTSKAALPSKSSEGQVGEKKAQARDSSEFVTIPCKYFKKGTCHRGNNCPFSHDWSKNEELYHWEAGSNCAKVKRDGTCAQGNTCPFASQHRLVKMGAADADSLTEPGLGKAKPKLTTARNSLSTKTPAQAHVTVKQEEAPDRDIMKSNQITPDEAPSPLFNKGFADSDGATAVSGSKLCDSELPSTELVNQDLKLAASYSSPPAKLLSLPPGLLISSKGKAVAPVTGAPLAVGHSDSKTQAPDQEKSSRIETDASLSVKEGQQGVLEAKNEWKGVFAKELPEYQDKQAFYQCGLGGASFFEELLGDALQGQPHVPLSKSVTANILPMAGSGLQATKPSLQSVPSGIWGFPTSSLPSYPLSMGAGLTPSDSPLYPPRTLGMGLSIGGLGDQVFSSISETASKQIASSKELSSSGLDAAASDNAFPSLGSLAGATLPSDLKESLGLEVHSTATCSPTDNAHFSDSKVSQLLAIFKNLGLEKYVDFFYEQEIDLEALLLMEDSDLKEIGIPMGPRRKLSHWIQEMRVKAKPAASNLTNGNPWATGQSVPGNL